MRQHTTPLMLHICQVARGRAGAAARLRGWKGGCWRLLLAVVDVEAHHPGTQDTTHSKGPSRAVPCERNSCDGQRLARWRASAIGPREQPHSPEHSTVRVRRDSVVLSNTAGDAIDAPVPATLHYCRRVPSTRLRVWRVPAACSAVADPRVQALCRFGTPQFTHHETQTRIVNIFPPCMSPSAHPCP